MAALFRNGVLSMEDLENMNDIPEGVARIEAMEHAMRTATPGEDVQNILMRAAMYYAFLTANRQTITSYAESGRGVPN